jgi:hypothetical protein
VHRRVHKVGVHIQNPSHKYTYLGKQRVNILINLLTLCFDQNLAKLKANLILEEGRLLGCYAVWLLYWHWHLVFLLSVRRSLVTASVVPSSPFLVTLMMEALSSSETSVLTRATRRNIPEYAILHNYITNLKDRLKLIGLEN